MAAHVDIRHEPGIEPLARPLPTNGAGEFQDLVRKPTPPSQKPRGRAMWHMILHFEAVVIVAAMVALAVAVRWP